MNTMNQVIIEGNVVRDSTSRTTPRGYKLCVMPIAVNRYYKETGGGFGKETGYFDVQAWGDKFCGFVRENARKGRGVRVIGRLKQDRWKAADGRAFTKTFIVAEHIDFKPQKKDDDGTDGTMPGQDTAPTARPGAPARATHGGDLPDELADLAEAAAGVRAEAFLESEAVF